MSLLLSVGHKVESSCCCQHVFALIPLTRCLIVCQGESRAEGEGEMPWKLLSAKRQLLKVQLVKEGTDALGPVLARACLL